MSARGMLGQSVKMRMLSGTVPAAQGSLKKPNTPKMLLLGGRANGPRAAVISSSKGEAEPWKS